MQSITFLRPEDVQLKIRERNTQTAQNVRTILENLAKIQPGKELIIDASSAKKFERYALQKALQKAGAPNKVFSTVSNGVNSKTGKPVMVIRRLSEAEWKEYLK